MRLKSGAARQVQAPRRIFSDWFAASSTCGRVLENYSVSVQEDVLQYPSPAIIHASFTDVSCPAHCIVCQAPRPNNPWTAARWNGA